MSAEAVPETSVVRFTVLGTVRAWRGETELNVGPPQQRAVLALLLANVGRPVSLSEIIEVLWGPDMPSTAANVVHRYVGMLRRVLEPDLPARAAGRWLVRSGGGYLIRADAGAVDLLRFRELCADARRWAGEGQPGQATEQFVHALALWQGPAASGIPGSARECSTFAALDREHLVAVAEAADVAARCGMVERVLPALRRSAERNPLDEPLHARLVIALAESGRQAEALDTWQEMRTRLRDELGVDPGPELRAAQSQVLDGSHAADASPMPVATPPTGPAQMAPLIRPAQLPAAPPAFAGRRAELAQLLTVPAADTMVITSIGGMAGIGKTTLAVQLAHRLADQFPDGQLYVNLRGFGPSGSAMDAADAVRGFVEALGVPPQRIPSGLDAQAALYRSLLVGRRVLVVLDNARDAEQVRPLLPGALGCMAVVTSRDPLHDLVAADGANPITLDVLTADDAWELLACRLSRPRVAAEPDAVQEIIELTGRLPLALSVVAARAAINPTFDLADVAAELRAAKGGLDGFASDIRAVFSWSYSALSPAAARLFRLLALHPGPDFGADAAASTGGVRPAQIRLLLAELTRAQLVTEHVPGRYQFHDLHRAYAGELLRETESDEDRRTAVKTMLDHYLRTALRAQTFFAQLRPAIDALVPPAEQAGGRSPVDWFVAERLVLGGVIRLAADHGFDDHVWQLVWCLEPFHQRRGHWYDWERLQQTAVDAARRLPGGIGLAHASRGLGQACSMLRRHNDALVHLGTALTQFAERDDVLGLAHTQYAIGWVHTRKDQHTEAIRQTRTALELYRQAGDAMGQAHSLNAIGWYESALGNHREGLTYAERSLALFRELGEDLDQSHAWDTLGHAHHGLGQHELAAECFHNAISRYRAHGDRFNEAGSLRRLGDNYASAGDGESAREQWRSALAILVEFDPQRADELRDKLRGSSPAVA